MAFVGIGHAESQARHLALVHLNVYIVAPINDRPFVSVPYPSDKTLQSTQVNNLLNTKIFVVVDAVP